MLQLWSPHTLIVCIAVGTLACQSASLNQKRPCSHSYVILCDYLSSVQRVLTWESVDERPEEVPLGGSSLEGGALAELGRPGSKG